MQGLRLQVVTLLTHQNRFWFSGNWGGKYRACEENSAATAGCELFLTKPLGIGVLTTAEKKGLLAEEHQNLAAQTMCQLNKLGAVVAPLPGVTAMTDVTGFGLLGHLSEICQGSKVRAEISFSRVPKLANVEHYIDAGCVPGGTQRNFESYGHLIGPMTEAQRKLLCDPQTSGGLLIAVEPSEVAKIKDIAQQQGVLLQSIGKLLPHRENVPLIEVID